MRRMIKAIAELRQYRDFLLNLVARDLKVRYKNSFLGVIWSWLNPLLMMLASPSLQHHARHGDGELPHLRLSGLLPWNYFSGSGWAASRPSLQREPHQKGLFSARNPAHMLRLQGSNF